MNQERPYFLTNPDWYKVNDIFAEDFPENGRGYELTELAPQEAIDSYNAFYADDAREVVAEGEVA